jgi:uncharacterized protein
MIWIDADACPRQVKEVVYNTSQRHNIPVTLVANSYQKIPKYNWIKLMVVSKGLDKADEHIIEHIKPQEIVITADIPFAAEAITKNAYVITPSGNLLDKDNINERLAMRNLLEGLRSSGNIQTKTKALSSQTNKKFADALDSLIVRVMKTQKKCNI